MRKSVRAATARVRLLEPTTNTCGHEAVGRASFGTDQLGPAGHDYQEPKMLLTPLSGGRDNLLNNLEFIRRELSNAKTSHTKVIAKHKAYLDAIGEGARLLRG
jgi:hypothetical protein